MVKEYLRDQLTSVKLHVMGRPYMISDGMGGGGVQPNLILYLRGH